MLNKKLLMGISNIEEIDTENALVFTLADEFDIDGNRFNFYKIDTNNNDQNNFNFYANNKKVNISSYSFKPNTQVIVKSKTNNFNYSGNFYQKSWDGPSSNGTIDSEYFFLAKSIDQPLPQWINKTTNIPKTSFRDFFQHSRLSFVPYNLFENNDQITLLTYSFYNCTNLTTPPDIPNNVTDMYCTFYKCTNLIGTLNIYSKIVSNSVYCFYNHSPSKNLDVYLPICYDNHVYTTTFNSFKNYTVNRVNGVLVHDINNIDYSQPEFSMQLVVNTGINNSFRMYNIFGEWDIDYGDGNVVHYAHTNNSNITYNYTNNGIYNITITNANISSINFRNTSELIEIKSPLPKFHVYYNLYRAFDNCFNLTTVPLNLFENNQEVNSMNSCFENCYNLTISPNIPNSVLSMTHCFRNCYNLTKGPTTLPNNEINMYFCFNECRNMTTFPEIPVNAINIAGCFSGCSNLTVTPNIPNGISSMDSCFDRCSKLTTAPNIPDTVVSMGSCFSGCSNLISIPKLPENVKYLGWCFSYCNKISEPPIIPNNVVSMYQCFRDCSNLKTMPNVPNSVTNIAYCFYDCFKLQKNTEIPNSITDMAYCFYGCTNLTTIQNIPDSVIHMQNCFNRCYNLSGTMNIYSTEIVNIKNCFQYHYTNRPLNVYIYTHYSNGEQTTTYNTFLNDTSHDGSGWKLGVPKLGITLKDINDKPNSNISIFIDSTQGKKGSEIYFIPYSSTGEPQSERIDIEYDTWYKYPVNIGDYYVFDGKPSTQTRAPEAGELNFYPIDMINCNYEEYYFEHHVTITGQNAVFTAYTD